MKFIHFPKKTVYYLVSSTKEACNSRIFDSLCIQLFPTNSWKIRALKSKLGLNLISLLKSNMEAPKESATFVGIVKHGNEILFELNDNNPIQVWRRDSNNKWNKSEFLGYPLIEKYTFEEYNQKEDLLKDILNTHWLNVQNSSSHIHGDFTHFNILYTKNNQFNLIDKKGNKHSKLFDHFYFYSYLVQCLGKCSTLSLSDHNSILKKLGAIITDVCQYKSRSSFDEDIQRMNIPPISGLENPKQDTQKFKSLFDSTF